MLKFQYVEVYWLQSYRKNGDFKLFYIFSSKKLEKLKISVTNPLSLLKFQQKSSYKMENQFCN